MPREIDCEHSLQPKNRKRIRIQKWELFQTFIGAPAGRLRIHEPERPVGGGRTARVRSRDCCPSLFQSHRDVATLTGGVDRLVPTFGCPRCPLPWAGPGLSSSCPVGLRWSVRSVLKASGGMLSVPSSRLIIGGEDRSRERYPSCLLT